MQGGNWILIYRLPKLEAFACNHLMCSMILDLHFTQKPSIKWHFLLFSTVFQSYHRDSLHYSHLSWVSSVQAGVLKCFANDTPTKNPADPLHLEPKTPGLQVKHSTTEPRRTRGNQCSYNYWTCLWKGWKQGLLAFSFFPTMFSTGSQHFLLLLSQYF